MLDENARLRLLVLWDLEELQNFEFLRTYGSRCTTAATAASNSRLAQSTIGWLWLTFTKHNLNGRLRLHLVQSGDAGAGENWFYNRRRHQRSSQRTVSNRRARSV